MLSNVTGGVANRVEHAHDLARIRHDTRDKLADQREETRRIESDRVLEEAKLNAERQQLEAEFCHANQEALKERLRSNIKETVESKVAFNLQQGMEIGELEVDVEELQELLKNREKQPPSPPEPLRGKPPCECCDQPCGCRPGLLRRLCSHCREKPCEAEKKCGGPEALTRLEEQPLRQPLRPTEIPLKLPVRLTFGMQQPSMEQARIRRQPLINEPLLGPPGRCDCDDCVRRQRCGVATKGNSGMLTEEVLKVDAKEIPQPAPSE
ncbi:MAG: hypothetical protein ACKO38_03345 [Planctomycetota bacterium]